MKRFKKILFVAGTPDRDTIVWERAVTLAQRNAAKEVEQMHRRWLDKFVEPYRHGDRIYAIHLLKGNRKTSMLPRNKSSS